MGAAAGGIDLAEYGELFGMSGRAPGWSALGKPSDFNIFDAYAERAPDAQ
jgi:hypothetical protein